MNPLEDWLDEWELELRGGTVSDGTITVYLRAGRHFISWLGKAHPDIRHESQIDRKAVLGWVSSRGDKSEATRRRDGIALRLFLGYIADQPDSGLTGNPAGGLDLPMPTLKPVPVISDDDLAILLKSMAGNDFVSRRDTAIVRMLLDTGCRRAELVGIDIDDLDMRHQEVIVHGKGRKDRIVPFGTRTALALRKYLRVRETKPAATSPGLILSTRANDRGNWRMTGGGVGEMLTRRCEVAGLGHVYPHMFRHTWAADLKSAGVHDDHLERLAGWSTPLMARRYGNAVADRQAREAAHRLARGDRV